MFTGPAAARPVVPDCAVVGLPDDKCERVTAVVQPRPRALSLTPGESLMLGRL